MVWTSWLGEFGGKRCVFSSHTHTHHTHPVCHHWPLSQRPHAEQSQPEKHVNGEGLICSICRLDGMGARGACGCYTERERWINKRCKREVIVALWAKEGEVCICDTI